MIRHQMAARHTFLLFCMAASGLAAPASGQLVFNEANAVSATEGTRFLSVDPGKPYEGYDYGAIGHSGNTNPPNAGQNPGNPFAPDLSSAPGTQTSFIDGFDTLTNPRGFARIQYNGGNWIELVVTHDHADLRGFTFAWYDNFDDDSTYGELRSQDPSLPENERGAVTFSNDRAWANLRAGTIITISDNDVAHEVRDDYPYGFPNSGLNDTGYDYDLSTDLSFNPFAGSDDWHVHFHLDESVTLAAQPADTQYFRANSDLEVSNEQWAGKVLDASSNLIESIRDPQLSVHSLDFETGELTGFIGENEHPEVSNFGQHTGGAGVGDDEAMVLLSDPDSGEIDARYFEDVDWTTFGMPNLFNRRTDVNDVDQDGIIDGDIVAGALEDDTTLSQVQNFSRLRNHVRDNTYNWTAGQGNFSTASNWQLAQDQSPAVGVPTANWTAELNNQTGGNAVAQVSSNAAVSFVTVSAEVGSMTLAIEPAATLTVTGDAPAGLASPGRVLVMEGGIVHNNGVVDAAAVETFGGSLSGSGSLTGDLKNWEGIVRPGDGSGGTLSVGGDFVQDAQGTLLIDITGSGAGDFGRLDVAGLAALDGFLEIALDGTLPQGSSLTVLTSAGLSDLGLSLIGDTNGFSWSIAGGTDLVLNFAGAALAGDFNGDGALDCGDINLLTGEIAAAGNDLALDLDGDGSITLADRDQWLAIAGQHNLPSGNPYLLGDANLDGHVNGQDFVAWNTHKFTSQSDWCAGDFNADGNVNGQDFVVWNNSKFTSADAISAVPEPAGAALLGLLLFSLRRPNPRRHARPSAPLR